jgi:hypothetical protein
MAKKKKAAPKKAKKKPAKKPARKLAKTKKKAAKKRAPAAKKTMKKPAAKPRPPVVVRRPAARMPSAPSAPTAPFGAAEQKVGRVVHYYTNLSVAVIRLEEGEVQVGDTIRIKGHTTDVKQKVESMEVEHQKIQRATIGQEFGLKVTGHVREHDEVYRVIV